MSNNTLKLHRDICKLFDLLNKKKVNVSKYEYLWNMITDINTNEIREKYFEEALDLYTQMKEKFDQVYG